MDLNGLDFNGHTRELCTLVISMTLLMKTKTLTTHRKMEFETPEIEIIPIQTSASFLASSEPSQNENTHEEDLF